VGRMGIIVFRLAAVTAALAAWVACPAAAEAADIGTNDDTAKFAEDGGARLYEQMRALGLRQTVMTVRFRPAEPDVIQDRAFLDRAIPEAVRQGLKVVLAIYPYPPRELELGLGTTAAQAFGAYAALVARTYPEVKQFVIGNEPNQPAFLRPQFRPDGTIASAGQAGALLAAAYDALKAVDPLIRVIGVGLSPRGNDNPRAPSNVSTSPVRFLGALGAWYRASGRRAPLMDGFSFHAYPARATHAATRRYLWPQAGFADLDRIKQALWDAFAGTRQPTTVNGLKLYLDEVGWQVDTIGFPDYTGVENVPVATEGHQARVYGRLVRWAACDPEIAELNFFGFVDDVPRDTGFQAALHRLDGTPRPAAGAVRIAIQDVAFGCVERRPSWRPYRGVVGASATAPRVTSEGRLALRLEAAEAAEGYACVLPASPRPSTTRLTRALQQERRSGGVGCAPVRLDPGKRPRLALSVPPTLRGRPLVAVEMTAQTNPSRRTLLVLDAAAGRR